MGARGRRLSRAILSLTLAATLVVACGSPTPSPTPTAALPAPSAAAQTAIPTPEPAGTASPPPRTDPPPVGLAAIAPGRPYDGEAQFRPRLEYDNNVLGEEVQSRLLAAAAAAIETVTGAPYVEVVATFTCTGTPICQLTVEGWTANANNPDTWYWDLGPDGSKFELDASGDPVTTWRSVPLDAVASLLEIVALDRQAAERASEYYALSYASWYPGQPQLLSLTYSRPSGATTDLLTITIDIGERRVLDYEEAVRDL